MTVLCSLSGQSLVLPKAVTRQVRQLLQLISQLLPDRKRVAPPLSTYSHRGLHILRHTRKAQPCKASVAICLFFCTYKQRFMTAYLVRRPLSASCLPCRQGPLSVSRLRPRGLEDANTLTLDAGRGWTRMPLTTRWAVFANPVAFSGG